MDIISREFQGIEIKFSTIDDVCLNATQTAKQFGKKPDNWLRNKDVQSYINALKETRFSNMRNELVIVKQGGNAQQQGTWIHKKLIINFARWLDPYFAVWCDEVIEEIISQRFAPKISLKEKLELE
ncbi:KilA-N domain-containing protein, partial [Thiovulum sp. ES]